MAANGRGHATLEMERFATMPEVFYALNYDITTSHEEYIDAGWRGPWILPPGTPPFCPGCKCPNSRLGSPLEISWNRGVGNIGDFTWMWNNTHALVTDRVASALSRQFNDFEFDPIVFRNRGNPFMRRTRMMTYNDGALPDGFRLTHLKLKHLVSYGISRSSVTKVNKCSVCGGERCDLTGVENWVGREPGMGFFVPRDLVKGMGAFRIRQYSGPQFVTERVREFIEDEGFTNVIFIEHGEFC